MELVNALLGDIFFYSGRVIGGRKLGGKIGFPTLNLPWSSDLKPPHGVYCVEVEGEIDGNLVTSKGVANFGVRPTVTQSNETVLEIHLLESCPFTEGQFLKVRWFHFIRPEMKFENLEALKKQIGADVETAKTYWKLG
jgi:riboflavin kinase / FMN adenylyltransferase